jgi:hypothetical protein
MASTASPPPCRRDRSSRRDSGRQRHLVLGGNGCATMHDDWGRRGAKLERSVPTSSVTRATQHCRVRRVSSTVSAYFDFPLIARFEAKYKLFSTIACSRIQIPPTPRDRAAIAYSSPTKVAGDLIRHGFRFQGSPTRRVARIQIIAVSILSMAGVVNYIDRGSLAIANTTIRADLGFSATRMGLLLSCILAVLRFCQLPVGVLLDRFGERRVLGAGMFLWSMTQTATGLVRGFAAFYRCARWFGRWRSRRSSSLR